MLPGFLDLCKLRHREVIHLRESPEAVCRRTGSGDVFPQKRRKRSPKNQEEKTQKPQKNLGKGGIFFWKSYTLKQF